MANKKKMKKKKSSKKKTVTRKKARSAVSTGARKVSAKARSVKSKAKARPATMQEKVQKKRGAQARKGSGRSSTPRDTARVFRSSLPTRGEGLEAVDVESKGMGANSGGQSGDLQGLSNVESADSESVGELLEEGNAYEAEIVKGVQDVPDADVSEVHTHQGREEEELPEDFREN